MERGRAAAERLGVANFTIVADGLCYVFERGNLLVSVDEDDRNRTQVAAMSGLPPGGRGRRFVDLIGADATLRLLEQRRGPAPLHRRSGRSTAYADISDLTRGGLVQLQ